MVSDTALDLRDAAGGRRETASADPTSSGTANGGERRTLTGALAELRFPLTEPSDSELVERALFYARALRHTLATDGEGLELVPDPHVHRTSSGGCHIHLYQQYRGIPVFDASRCVSLDGRGRLRRISGDSVPIGDGVDTRACLPAVDAVERAVAHLAREDRAVERSRSRPRTIASFPLPSQPTLLAKRGIEEPIRAQLTLFYLGTDLRLGWLLSLRAGDEDYDLIVDATLESGGEILYCRATLDRVKARGRVFATSPDDGDRRLLDFPPPLDEYPVPVRPDLPADFPWDWVDGRRARGLNAAAFRGNTNRSLVGSEDGEGVLFDPPAAELLELWLLNAFYFCNYLHDLFYLLGFREAEGNFQRTNFTGVDGEDDELFVRVFNDDQSASMRSRRDGKNGELELGRVPRRSGEEAPSGEDLRRHAALDADIVFHEYVHGVTNRMVGGRLNFDPFKKPQSRALAEGYSDYFALTLQNVHRPAGQEKVTLGAYASGDPSGLRRLPYDQSFAGHFGLLGTEGFTEPHDAGQVWCASLLAMNRRLGVLLGDPEAGHQLGWQLVIDSLKVLPTHAGGPSFLDARDALLDIVDEMQEEGELTPAGATGVRQALLGTFLRFRMGPAARSDGASYDGIAPDPPDEADQGPNG